MLAATLRLTMSLVNRAGRADAAQALATHAKALVVQGFVADPQLRVLVPAPGFAQTLASGRAWRPLIKRSESPGIHHGQVPLAAGEQPHPAIACADEGVALVFIGPETDIEIVRDVQSVLPAIGSAFRTEQELTVALGALRTEQEGARIAQTLTRALETARSELEMKARSLDEARTRAEQAARAKDEFLAMLGHELRNPLAPIVTALHLMRLRGVTSREQDIIERHVSHLMRLVDDLLDVARITQGKIDLRREHIELSKIASRAIEMTSPLLERKRQTLEVDISPCGLLVDVDPQRMAQVLANLLSNASRYSESGTRIVVRAARVDDRIVIRVIDQGEGIGPEMLTTIFDAFVQHRDGDHGNRGLGLGLAIVHSLVTLHGGSVRADSAGRGRGAELTVELPVAQAQIAAQPVAAPVHPPVSRPAQDGARVLVVDDNADGAEMLAEVLTAEGYNVRIALDGPKALDVADQFKPSIVLLDLGLPVMDGYEVAQRLRAGGNRATPHLVAITGYGQEADRARTAATGFEAHLIKPVDLDLLKRVLLQMSAGAPAVEAP